MGHKLLLLFWREILALIYDFTCQFAKLPWQCSVRLSAKMSSKFWNVKNKDVRALKEALVKPKHMKEHFNKDPNRYCVDKFRNLWA